MRNKDGVYPLFGMSVIGTYAQGNLSTTSEENLSTTETDSSTKKIDDNPFPDKASFWHHMEVSPQYVGLAGTNQNFSLPVYGADGQANGTLNDVFMGGFTNLKCFGATMFSK